MEDLNCSIKLVQKIRIKAFQKRNKMYAGFQMILSILEKQG